MSTDRTLLAQGRSGQSPLSDDVTLPASASSSSGWWLPLVGLVTAALCLPFIRTVYSMGAGDEGVLLNGAERMLRGGRLYADFFEFLPPGGFVLTEAWFGVAGVSFASARLLVVVTFVGIACFTFLACRRASKNALLSAGLTVGWVAMSQGFLTLLSHHWLTTLFSMATAWAALAGVEAPPRRRRWPLMAGAAAGAAAMITPTRGALAMLAGVTPFLNLRRQRAELIAYVLGAAIVPVGLLAYVVGQHAFAAAFDDVIRYPAGHYAAVNVVPFGYATDLVNYPLKYLYPLAGVLTLFVVARDWRGGIRDPLLRACAAFGVAGFVGCFPRAEISHIDFTTPLVLPLLACCISRLAQRWRPAYCYMVAAVVIALCAPAARALSWSIQTAVGTEAVPTPRGRVAYLAQPAAPALLARIAATPSGDAYFFYPYMPLAPFLTSREQVSRYDVFTPGYTSAAHYQDACLSVMRRASWVVIDRNWTNPATLKRTFPSMQNARPPETSAFEQALENGFELVAQDGTFELRHRRDGANDTLCVGIAD
jgi:hypothetical protein